MNMVAIRYIIHHPFCEYSKITGNSANLCIGKLYDTIIIRDINLNTIMCQIKIVNVFLPIKFRILAI